MSRGSVKGAAALWLVLAMGGMTPPEAPVADAAMRGDVATVRELLRAGADVNAAQGDGMTALHWAARRGDAELAEILVYAGAKLDAGTRIGRYTPLHIAAREARADVVDVLLEAGADVGARTTNSGVTPLHLAARSGDPRIVSKLIEHGADVEAREASWGQTPLTFAAAMNRTEAIGVLLEAGADPDAAAEVVDVVEMDAADQAADRRLQEALDRFKKEEGGGPSWRPTPAQVQAAVDLARQVQARWPDVPKEDEGRGATAGQEGAQQPAGARRRGAAPQGASAGHEPVERVAPASGATQEEAGTDDAPAVARSPLTRAKDRGPKRAHEDEPQPMSYAEQVGAWGGLTPLHLAVREGHVEATRALLAGGADIDRPSGDHSTPLLIATINGQWDLALMLLSKGADPTIASSAGATPLYAVLEREWEPRSSYAHPTGQQQQRATHLELMEALLRAGADPNARLTKHLWYMEYTFGVLRGSGIDLQGATPFWRAAYALDVDAMRLLAAWGADPDIRTMKPAERRRRQAAMEEGEKEEEGEEGAAAEEGADPRRRKPAKEGREAKQEDKSGLPPVLAGGPAIHAIHAASGVGYGQSFAGNAHRHVPNGWMPAVRFLVEEMGADVNARDANGYTALHHAASRGDVEMIRYLVDHGAVVTVVSRKGETTADMANGPVQRVQPFPEAVALLEQLGSTNSHNCVSCE